MKPFQDRYRRKHNLKYILDLALTLSIMTHKKCPYCSEDVLKEAIFCKHCKTDLSNRLENEIKNIHTKKTDNPLTILDNLKNKLSSKQLQLLHMELIKQRRNIWIAYLLWFFLGVLGIHQFYIGYSGSKLHWGGIHIISLILGPILIGSGATGAMLIGSLLLCAVGIKLIYDMFTIPTQVKKANEIIEYKIIEKITV